MVGASLTAQDLQEPYRPEPGPWSYRIDIGGNVPNDPDLTLYDGPVTGGESLKLDAGLQFDMGLGYRVAPWLTLEGELGFLFNHIDSVGNWSYPDSSLTQMTFMLNVMIQRPIGPLVPYAGVGAGGVFSTLSFGNYDYYYYYYNSPDGYGNNVAPTAQIFGGLSYEIGRGCNLGVSYRYLVTASRDWDVEWWNGADFTVGADSTTTHFVSLTLSVSF
jgi:hypothetical protein